MMVITRLRYWARRQSLSRWVAWRLPDGVVYHALIRAWGHGTVGEYGKDNPTFVAASDIVARWAKDKGVKE